MSTKMAALAAYGARYEYLATEAQLLVARGRFDEAEAAHAAAWLAVRTYVAEADDPVPVGLPVAAESRRARRGEP